MSAGSVRSAERWSTLAATAAMLATPFTKPGTRARLVATSMAVVAGAARSVTIDARRPGIGPRRAVAGAGLTAVTATVIEVVGTRTGMPFGRYRYTAALRPQVGGVPVHVAAAWTAMVPAAAETGAAVAEVARRRGWPLDRLVVGALALTAWDVFLDPQMTRDGVWVWSRPGRFRGVPVRNFAGWFVASTVLLAVRRRVVGGPVRSASARERDAVSGAGPESAHIATYGAVAVLSTAAFVSFWRDRLVALAGGSAMLPLAAVAWRAR